jgi:hypothetical protein
VIQSVAEDDDFVGSEGNDDFCVRSLGAQQAGPRKDVFPFVEEYV